MLNIKRKKNGFLLIDILVSAGIFVILAGIGIPYIRKYQPNLKLDASARNLTADLRLAQQLTITEQVVHIVNFDFSNDSYSILRLGTATTTVKSVSLDSEIGWQEISGLDDNKVFFNFYGGVSQPGQIILNNANGRSAIINIKPSGYVQLE